MEIAGARREVKGRLQLVWSIRTCSPWCSHQEGWNSPLGPCQRSSSNGPDDYQFCLHRKEQKWWVKISQSYFRKQSQNIRQLCKQYKLLGKVGVNGGNGDKAGHCHSPPCWPQRCSPGSAQTLGLRAVIALVSQIWKFATSASQIKIEMSFATMAKKKAILHFIDL